MGKRCGYWHGEEEVEGSGMGKRRWGIGMGKRRQWYWHGEEEMEVLPWERGGGGVGMGEIGYLIWFDLISFDDLCAPALI